MNASMKLPWYKQPLVWMLIAIPGSAVLAGMVTMYLAVNTDDGLVVDDYYKQGLAINQQIERDVVAQQLQLAADIEIDPDSGFIRVVFDGGRMQQLPSELNLNLRHATQQQNDDYIVLQRGIGNNYVGTSRGSIRVGIWHVELANAQDEADDSQQNWRLSKRVRLEGFTRLRLQADMESGGDEINQGVL